MKNGFHGSLTGSHYARFSAGKASALVIDIGASNLSVTPVHDGLILKKGQLQAPSACCS